MSDRTPPAPEWNATVYHRVSDPHLTWGAKTLSWLDVSGDETALDCGCGTGRLTAELLDRLPNGNVIAIDRSSNMLQAAREFLSPSYGSRVSFLQADLQTLDANAIGVQVDLIFSTATFHWILDHPRLFANLFGMLRPGGWLVAQCGGGDNLARLLARASQVQQEEPFASYFGNWPGPWEFANDKTTYRRLNEAGFEYIETDLESTPTFMPDGDAYREFLTNVIFGAHLARLPDPELRERYIGILTGQAENDDPPFLLDYWRLNMRARRPKGET